MADQLQIRGGNTADNATFTGAQRELSIDTVKNQIIVHDGATVGGHPVAPQNSPEFTGTVSHPLGSAAAPTITFTGDTNTGIYSPGADQVAITTGGSERLQIDSSGNVFIGGTTAASADIALNANGSSTFVGPATINFPAANVAQNGLFVNANTNLGTKACISLRNEKDTGLLLRGTSADSTTTTVTIAATGAATFAGAVSSGTVSSSASYSKLGSGLILSYRLPSGSSSNVFQGGYGSTTTSEILANGSASLNQTVNSQSNELNFTNNGSVAYLELRYAGSQRILMQSSTGNTASNVSDIRFKENITDANPQLADAVALGSQLKNWNWKDEAPLNEELRAKRFLGLVAQEAEKVCPGLTYVVPRTKQGKELTPEVVVPAVYEDQVVPAVIGEDGETVEPETTKQVLVTEEQVTPATYEELDDSYKAINHDILVMKLLGAVAELSAKVAALESA